MSAHTYAGDDAILTRAQAELAKLRGQQTPMMVPALIALVCLVAITCACVSEFFSAGIGFQAAFPTKSDGTSLADALMTLRYPIIFCLLAGDVILQSVPNRAKFLLDWLTHSVGVWAILVLLFGVGAFMFSATFVTLGSGDDQGFASHFVGLALGLASAAMFTLSFLATHALMGKLFSVIPVIAKGLAERKHIKAGELAIREVEASRKLAEGLRSAVTELEKPDAIKRRTANEAGAIVGKHIAAAHDMVASAKAMGSAQVEPQDRVEVPRVPLAALEARLADLKAYTSDYFFNLLKQKEA